MDEVLNEFLHGVYLDFFIKAQIHISLSVSI